MRLMTTPKQPKQPKQLALLDWPDSKRAFPVPFGRSSLFRVGDKREPRQVLRKVAIATVNDYSLHFTGEELRIDDEDVLLQLLHLAKGQDASPKGFQVEFSSSSMLAVLEWGNGAAAHERLRACIERLQNGSIALRHLVGNTITRDFYGSFLAAAFREGNSRASKWVVFLNEASAKLLMPRAELDWPTRLALRSDLARWLQTFIESESMGAFQDHSVDELLRLSGSKAKEISNFKTSLKRAFEELSTSGVIQSYEWIAPRVVRIHVPQHEESL